ncbi:Dehydrogenase/reductase SDR family protein 7 [Blattella germanica]|nr:Dehydrogenase/reductase SDR family protein 7 [Blattella germanica]
MKGNNEWTFPLILGGLSLTWIVYHIFGTVWSRRLRNKLRDKVVLITGASSGLGESLAHSLHKDGCRVILAARRKDELERVKKDLNAKHKEGFTHKPEIVVMDLADLNSLPERAAQALAIFGHIDILINNGGIGHRGDVLETDIDVAIRVMTVNFFGQMALTKAVLPSMISQKSGHIVAVSSIQGLIAIPYSDSLRAEVAEHNIKVSVISPGYIATAISINALTGSGEKHGVMDKNTAEGYKPEYCAEEIVKAIVHYKKELVITPLVPRLARLIRTLAPSLYFRIMAKRALKRSE